MKRDDGGGVHLFSQQEAFDEMSTGLASGAITRGRAIKLAGAALVASALGLSYEGAAQARFGEFNRKKCEAKGGVFCRSRETGQKICCRARKTPCCGKFGAQCCGKGAKCVKGKCVRT